MSTKLQSNPKRITTPPLDGCRQDERLWHDFLLVVDPGETVAGGEAPEEEAVPVHGRHVLHQVVVQLTSQTGQHPTQLQTILRQGPGLQVGNGLPFTVRYL